MSYAAAGQKEVLMHADRHALRPASAAGYAAPRETLDQPTAAGWWWFRAAGDTDWYPVRVVMMMDGDEKVFGVDPDHLVQAMGPVEPGNNEHRFRREMYARTIYLVGAA